ncbi:trypsin-like serine peptidase [Candidatus Paracaedibacter symbiosus]|uniref:trypsin-like serine peptidase n=1 Tax=Candidatus Paracaedibacter symbiosus TaxID=244582 RepID=UPI000509DCA0|nr:hypothetical protein [Candidatus Paracaedibacter symbiosus]
MYLIILICSLAFIFPFESQGMEKLPETKKEGLKNDNNPWITKKYDLKKKEEGTILHGEKAPKGNYVPCNLKDLNEANFRIVNDAVGKNGVREQKVPHKLSSQADDGEEIAPIYLRVNNSPPQKDDNTESLLKKSEDRRSRIYSTYLCPYSFYGILVVTFDNPEEQYISTGVLTGPKHVLTAAHSIFSGTKGGWATSVKFYPGRNDEQTLHRDGDEDIGYEATDLICYQGWTKKLGSNDANNQSSLPDKQIIKTFDIGMVILDQEIGEDFGWAGLFAAPDKILSKKKIQLPGYPGDKGGAQLWTMQNTVGELFQERIAYAIDSSKGQSGSGVWTSLPGKEGYYLVGIHAYGEEEKGKGNIATRISSQKFHNILAWMGDFGYLRDPAVFTHPLLFDDKRIRNIEKKADNKQSENRSRYQYYMGVYYEQCMSNTTEESERANAWEKAKDWYMQAAENDCWAAIGRLGIEKYRLSKKKKI